MRNYSLEMSRAIVLISLLALAGAGCSSNQKKESLTYPAGDKVTVGPLVYNVIDTQILTQLGDDPATARSPQNRFYLMTIAVSNASTDDLTIPSLTLIDDSGKEFPELADGTNVPKWLGVVRRVSAAQTEQGNIVFDAPAAHYRLRLTDEAEDRQLFADIPLSFVHEQMRNLADAPAPDRVVPVPAKK